MFSGCSHDTLLWWVWRACWYSGSYGCRRSSGSGGLSGIGGSGGSSGFCWSCGSCVTGGGQKIVHFGPNMACLSIFQSGPQGSKTVVDHLGPFSAHLGTFGPLQTKIYFLLQSTSAKSHFLSDMVKSVKSFDSKQSYPPYFD